MKIIQSKAATPEYKENWERIFGKKEENQIKEYEKEMEEMTEHYNNKCVAQEEGSQKHFCDAPCGRHPCFFNPNMDVGEMIKDGVWDGGEPLPMTTFWEGVWNSIKGTWKKIQSWKNFE